MHRPKPAELDDRLQETIGWWQTWCARGRISGPYTEQLQRSAIVLNGLSNAPTGAIAAAPTTSLPESPGGCRSWDYRFSCARQNRCGSAMLPKASFSWMYRVNFWIWPGTGTAGGIPRTAITGSSWWNWSTR